MPGESRSSLDWRSYAIPLRVAAVFVAVAMVVWELLGPPPAELWARVFTARAAAIGFALLVAALTYRTWSPTVLKLLALALGADVLLFNAVLVLWAPQAHDEALLVLVAVMMGGAMLIPWSWRWQAVLATAVGGASIGLLYASAVRSQVPPWQIPRMTIALVTAAVVSVIGSLVSEIERSRRLASEDRYGQLFRDAGDGIVVLDRAGLVHECNPRFAQLVGTGRKDIVGRPIAELCRPETAPDTAALLEAVVQASADPRTVRASCEREDGSRREMEITMAAVRATRGTLVQAIVRDLTDQIALQRHEDAARRYETVTRMAGRFAHEFNNLLGAVLAGATLLRTRAAAPGDAEALDEMVSSARQGRELTKRLLRYTGQSTVVLQRVGSAALVEDLEQRSRATLPATVTVVVDAEPGVPDVEADPEHLRHALLELVQNAREAMRAEGGRLTLAVAREHVAEGSSRWRGARPGDYVRFTVADTGTGMEEATRDRLFEPFFTTKPLYDSTGLGLAAVHWVVHAHRGAAQVDTVPGRGTSVHLIIPVAPGAEPQPASPAPPAARTLAGASVLVADDEAIIRRTARRALTHFGAIVAEAADGDAAVRVFTAAQPPIDLVLLDVVMPGGGLALFQRLKALRPDVRVLLCTGYGPEGEAQGILDAGADGFLPKPFELEELRSAAEAALAGR